MSTSGPSDSSSSSFTLLSSPTGAPVYGTSSHAHRASKYPFITVTYTTPVPYIPVPYTLVIILPWTLHPRYHTQLEPYASIILSIPLVPSQQLHSNPGITNPEYHVLYPTTLYPTSLGPNIYGALKHLYHILEVHSTPGTPHSRYPEPSVPYNICTIHPGS